ncbi:MAG: hypothetical protein QOE76_190 [Frankiales bacterium]|jgi:thioredoxin reductase|nr:hypothetical protein [Frankiales bacterium]
MTDGYDVIVVGGGAAGLSAGLTLARARRPVLVVDAGDPRNAPADGVHGFLSREGVAPARLLAAGRAELLNFGGELRAGKATAARVIDNGFEVDIDADVVRARRLIVATGLVDELPDLPGLRERWGRDVLHCPYCHGWEVRDQRIGVLARGPLSVHQAQLFRQWSADVSLFTHTHDGPTDEQLEQLAARGIRVVPGEVTEVVVAGGRLSGLRIADDSVVGLDAVVVGPRMAARSEVLESLGIEPADLEYEGHVVGTYIAAESTGRTELAGVYVAGNVADLQAQVMAAAAAGVKVAAAVNADLIEEEITAAVARHRG